VDHPPLPEIGKELFAAKSASAEKTQASEFMLWPNQLIEKRTFSLNRAPFFFSLINATAESFRPKFIGRGGRCKNVSRFSGRAHAGKRGKYATHQVTAQ